MMTQVEARYIGRKIGVLPRIPTFSALPKAAYIGEPCVFLQDGKCQIYEHRPFACRVYFSVDDNPQACEIVNPKAPGHVAQLDHTQFYAVAGRALEDQMDYLADIREFFGKGQK
jgi:Fe-S-cluster containining protein